MADSLSAPRSNSKPNQSLSDRIRSFVHYSRLPVEGVLPHGPVCSTVTHEFHGVSSTAFEDTMRELNECGNPLKLRFDFLGAQSLLVVTLPGMPHEIVTSTSQTYIRQTLYEQGFYWPKWGNDIERIHTTGATDRKVGPDGEKGSIFQPDGSLMIKGVSMPFLVIEVADSESYRHVRRKSLHLLRSSKGKIRFVVIIDLIRKKSVEMKEDGTVNDSHHDQLHIRESTSNKRAAFIDSDPISEPVVKKRIRVEPESSTSVPVPGTPETLTENTQDCPDLPQAIPTGYSRANVTVLTTIVTPHPTIPDHRQRTVSTLVDAAECWPAIPGPESSISFTWDDMMVKDYPAELKDKVFTLSWGFLHSLLTKVFSPCEDVPVEAEDGPDVLMEKSSDEPEEFFEEIISSGKVGSDDSWFP